MMQKEILAWSLVFILYFWMDLCHGNHIIILATCNENVKLPCRARHDVTTDYKYRFISWYKNNMAIIKRRNNEIVFYNNSASGSLEVKETLVLLNVQPYDSGDYSCYLAADIGHQDMRSLVKLNVSECPTSTPTEDPIYLPNVVEVSVFWMLIGFGVISLCKIIFCQVTVMIFNCYKEKKEMRGRQKSAKILH